jgi:hypothetical protein
LVVPSGTEFDRASGILAATNESVEVGFKIEDPPADLYRVWSFAQQRPHRQRFRLMAEVARGVLSGHSAVRQNPDPNLLNGSIAEVGKLPSG